MGFSTSTGSRLAALCAQRPATPVPARGPSTPALAAGGRRRNLAQPGRAGRARGLRGGLTDCPRSRDRDRRHAAQRHRRDGRCRPARLPRRLAGRRARHAVRPKASACRSSWLARAGAPVENAVGRAAAGLAVGHADGRPRSTPGSTSRPMTASTGPGRSPRPPLERHRFHAAASGGRGRRRMADAPSAPSRCGKRGQQGTRWIAAWGRPPRQTGRHRTAGSVSARVTALTVGSVNRRGE